MVTNQNSKESFCFARKVIVIHRLSYDVITWDTIGTFRPLTANLHQAIVVIFFRNVVWTFRVCRKVEMHATSGHVSEKPTDISRFAESPQLRRIFNRTGILNFSRQSWKSVWRSERWSVKLGAFKKTDTSVLAACSNFAVTILFFLLLSKIRQFLLICRLEDMPYFSCDSCRVYNNFEPH